MAYCEKCGCELQEDAKFCSECGQPIEIKTEQYRQLNNEEKIYYCSNCGYKLQDGFEFCPECGVDLTTGEENVFSSIDYEETKKCPKCGESMPADAFYCFYCGELFENQKDDFDYVKTQVTRQFGVWKNKWIALLLCIFFGWFGAHKYYEGKIGMGLLYTFTLGLFSFGWLIDIIVLAFKPNPYRAKR